MYTQPSRLRIHSCWVGFGNGAYAFRKYTIMPEYSIPLAGLVLVKGHIHFGRVYYNTGTSLLGWFWQRCIRISKVYATQPVAYTLLLGWFWQRDICISEGYYAGLFAGWFWQRCIYIVGDAYYNAGTSSTWFLFQPPLLNMFTVRWRWVNFTDVRC